MTEIKVKNLTKVFITKGRKEVAVNDLSYSFKVNEVTCLLGPSGCGKTTLLRMIAGLLPQTGGKVFFNDECVDKLKPRERDIGMVFQYPVVYSGLNVYQNIELPLLHTGLSSVAIKERVETVVDLLSLQDSLKLMVNQLDNGTKQKVSVAREVARHPKILLFDEPITNIDSNHKLEFKRAFKKLTKKLNQTIIYVTHDQTEAMTLGDRIALMKDGKIVQYEKPRIIYSDPSSVFGGWFLGNPGMNFFEKRKFYKKNGFYEINDEIFSFKFKFDLTEPEKALTIGVRPEDVLVGTTKKEGFLKGSLKKKIITIGGQYLLTIGSGKDLVKAKCPGNIGKQIGDEIYLEFPLEKIRLFKENGDSINCKLEKLN